MSCLLGIQDEQINRKHRTSWQTNKIGGTSDWYGASVVPVCPVCGARLVLVVQLYCPLHDSPYHRTLYIYTCCHRNCWNSPHSWQVYRCQSRDRSAAGGRTQVAGVEVTPSHSGMEADNWGNGADDWGNSADDWGSGVDVSGTGVNDLGTGVDGWSEESQDRPAETHGVEWEALQVCGREAGSTSDGPGTESHNAQGMLPELVTADRHSRTSADEEGGDILVEIPVQELTLGESDVIDPGETTPVVAEDMPVISTAFRHEVLTSSQQPDPPVAHSQPNKLLSYYLNVFEEPANENVPDSHVTRLLKEYERQEGHSLTGDDPAARSSGGGTEAYERTSVVHRDLTFHRFIKRTSLCPQQCIRYSWEGCPLYISVMASTAGRPHPCLHCGGATVFELQLMPTLVNILQTEATSVTAVEFGTVLVYSCKASCWQDGDHYRQEQIVLQPDPDQHLYH